ncbi:MAG: hypothetical protein KAQ98_13305 [Bacteriovoracaceae bacterium]|nr:hypothetical protein [Bacteriovoracaceae bacterium]
MMRFSLVAIMAIIISTCVSADELYGFCFGDNVSLQSVRLSMDPILLSRDKIFFRKSMNCIEVKLSKARKDLFEKYISKKFTISKIYSETAREEIFTETIKNCRILIIKKKKVSSKEFKAGVGKRTRLSQKEIKRNEVGRTELLLGEGLIGKIEVGGDFVEVECKSRANDNYVVQVHMKKENKSNDSSSSSSGSLSTTIQIKRGEKINIGSIVENLKNRDRKISVDEGVNYSRIKGETTYDYELVIQ